MSSSFSLLRLAAVLLALVMAAFLGGCDAADPTASSVQAVLAPESVDAPAEAEATFTPGPFRCDQTNPTRPEYYESVTGTIDARGVPTDVTVFRTNNPDQIDSYRATAKRVRNYWGPVPPGTIVWNATGHPPGTPDNTYFLAIPPANMLPPAGAAFDGELHVYFGPQGQWGWWQTIQECTML